jgi:ubiquinone/menaquinone biosynthesis C-methylase UbiE
LVACPIITKMTINESIAFTISPGLQTEIDHLVNEQDTVYDSIEHLKEATCNSLHEAIANELLSQLPPNSKIVDLGCGFGETSLIIASKGHEVHSIEPAPNRCRAVSKSLKNLGLNGTAYLCTSEDLDKIHLKNFDGALFFSSLHHCDHPLQALKNTKKILGPKGVIVINEPILKSYRSKKWFNKQLIENPVKMGHYGGNEHIYYFKEYYNMLKEAGFSRIEFHWANRKIDPRKTLVLDLSRNTNGSHQHSVLRCFIKYLIHVLVKNLCKNPFLNRLFVRPLLKMSLLQASFVGYV